MGGHRQGPQILFLCSTPIFCVAPDRSYSFPNAVRGPTCEMVCQQGLLDQIPLQKTRAPRLYCCSVTKLGPTCWDPFECSKPGLLVPHHLPEFVQVHVLQIINRRHRDVKILAQEHTASIGWKCQAMREYSNAAVRTDAYLVLM